MRIVAFSDMHGSMGAIAKLSKLAKNADALVSAGDISIFERDLRKILTKFNAFGIPLIKIAGNHESDESIRKHSKGLDNIIHVKDDICSIGNRHFLCASGDGFSIEDPNFEKIGKRFLVQMKKIRKEDPLAAFILITHAPPHNTRLDEMGEGHCGNKSIRRFIAKARPEIAISGHIHENEGRSDRIGKTRLLNPGPNGKIVII